MYYATLNSQTSLLSSRIMQSEKNIIALATTSTLCGK